MISNFSYFLYNNDLQDYLNCYSTFLMTRKDLKDNILNHRMNFLINYYISQEKFNAIHKYKLIQTYLYSYKDNYLKKLKNETKDEIKDETKDEINYDDDLDDHYKYMFMNTKPKVPVIDYDELDKEYILKLELEEEEKKREKEIQAENDYDDYYYNNDDENYDVIEDYSEEEVFDDDYYSYY